jgi:chlorite dismutase
MPDPRDPPPTDEGWYALHDFRTIDWDAWRDTPERERQRILAETIEHMESTAAVEDAEEGATALYSILGHKADFLVVHLRPSSAHIGALERSFEQTAFAGYTERTTSFVSVTEASGYSERAREYFEGDLDEDSGLANYIQTRLHPQIPDAEHVCFYPMNKRRQPEQNWYDLSFEERAEHMEAHGDIGRDYGGRVVQMITGAIALDDWEWGVTLWGDDLTDMKDLLYEMRFDPSTSQFAEFGPFYIGRRIEPSDLPALLSGAPVPTDGESAPGQHAQTTHAGAGAHGTNRNGAVADASHGESASTSSDVSVESTPVHPDDTSEDSDSSATHETDEQDAHGAETDAHGAETDAHETGSTDAPASEESESSGATSAVEQATGGPPVGDGDSSWQDVDDIEMRLKRVGIFPGEEFTQDGFALVLYSGEDAKTVADEVGDLRENFEHYDTHVMTAVRAQSGRTAIVSIWDAERAANTAHGFLRDLPDITESYGGPVEVPEDAIPDGAKEATEESTDDDDTHEAAEESADIREELRDLDVYAGQPHGEDIYALVLYSRAEMDTLTEEVSELSDGFDRYDTHEGTTLYDDPDSDTKAVVSLWETADAADTASGYLTDLPEIAGWAGEGDGFGTMGMFYTVKPEHREAFVETFNEVGEMLGEMAGHRETALLVNTGDENDMFIASQWDSRDDAMEFFRSDAFAETVDWGRDVLADKPRHVFLA